MSTELLVEKMRKELLTCKSGWVKLSKLTGRQLSYRWIVGFAHGEIRDPSISKIILLGNYIGMKVTLVKGPHYLKFKPE